VENADPDGVAALLAHPGSCPSGLNAPWPAVLCLGSGISPVRPPGRSSTCTRQPPAQAGIQAICVGLAAITSTKERVTRWVPGSHSSYLKVPELACSCTSSRPARVPRSITYPVGSLSRGPIAAPVTLTSCAVPAAVLMSAPSR